MNEIFGLDLKAWEKWIEYRRKLRKAYRTEFAIERAQKKLASFGDYQMHVVEQSMEREWTGLFPLNKGLLAELEKAKRVRETEAREFEALSIRADRIRFRAPRVGETSRDYRISLESAERAFEDARYRERQKEMGPRSLAQMLRGAT
jgi:hypothetical protein